MTQKRERSFLIPTIAAAAFVAFVSLLLPFLNRTTALEEAATLVARAAQPGDLVLFPEHAQQAAEISARIPPEVAVLFMDPKDVSQRFFRSLIVVTEGTSEPPENCEVLETKEHLGATIVRCRPNIQSRLLAEARDSIEGAAVETVRGQERRACDQKDEAFVCDHLDRAVPLSLATPCPGLDERGAPALLLRTSPGAGFAVSLPQPEGSRHLRLRSGRHTGPASGLNLKVVRGAVQRMLTLAGPGGEMLLTPLPEQALSFEIPPQREGHQLCLTLDWEGEAQPVSDTWGGCVTLGRNLAARAPEEALRLFVRGASGLRCLTD